MIAILTLNNSNTEIQYTVPADVKKAFLYVDCISDYSSEITLYVNDNYYFSDSILPSVTFKFVLDTNDTLKFVLENGDPIKIFIHGFYSND